MLQLRVLSKSTMCDRPSINRCSFSANDDGVCTYRVYVWIFVGKPPGSHPSCAQEARKKIKETNCLFFRLCRRK